MQEAVFVIGMQASGKTNIAKSFIDKGYANINRDKMGGSLSDLLPYFMAALDKGNSIILDNTFVSVMSRKPFIGAAMAAKIPCRCIIADTSIEDAQFNAVQRIIQLRGKLLSPEEIKKDKSPNIFPPTVLFSFRKKYEEPTLLEGFESIEKVPFVRQPRAGYVNKALILDYDGTLRKTKSGADYPLTPEDVEILPNRKEVLKQYKAEGYLLLGVSNQSGVVKGVLTDEVCRACFERTNQLLGQKIEYVFCPHNSFPISCYCRKPMSGHGVMFIEKHKLDASKSIMVGDFKTDETFAKRSGFQYQDASEFFK